MKIFMKHLGGDSNYKVKSTIHKCRGWSPDCDGNFIITRIGQKQCIGCLRYKNILQNYEKMDTRRRVDKEL